MALGNFVWVNGQIGPEEEHRISLFTHALHYGTGGFEGIRCYKQHDGSTAVFRLHEHMTRLQNTSKILGLSTGYTTDELCQASLEVVRKNNFEECYIRPIVFVGQGPLGVSYGDNPPVVTAILTWEWGKYLGDEGMTKGVRLRTSSFIRPQPNSIMTKGKISGQYVTGVLSKQEALRDGYDEGLLLDPEGFLAEGTGENLFMIKDGLVKTTPLTSILGGITRATVMEHLRQQGHYVEEQRFTRDELWCADEVFMCGTAAEITPVREIDNRQIGEGKPGPITSKLQSDYMNIVRGDTPEYGKAWLTKV